jgi:hypothetical protein
MEKYFLQNDETGYFVQIFEDTYSGASTEIFGKLSFDKGSVDNILDTIRGTGINLSLEASFERDFDEFSIAYEKKFTVKVSKDNKVVFNGFLKPDGVSQSFIQDLWFVKVDFIDGLGTLKDLSFVKPNGNPFTGKMSMYDVISNCLNRTGLTMTINSFIDVYYIGYTGSNILKDVYVSTDRFVKVDDDTIMTCEEILNSMLNLCSACIVQQDGQWWIYRPNDLTQNTTFIDNTLNTTFVKNLYFKVGSQIDNFYPHHCGANQEIMTKGAISAYRISYKYGFKSSVNFNPNLNHDSLLTYPNWTKGASFNSYAVNDPNDNAGLIMNTVFILSTGFTYEMLKSDVYNVLAGSQIDVNLQLYSSGNGENTWAFNIKRSDGYWADKDGSWKNTEKGIFTKTTGIGSFDFNFKTDPVPNNVGISVIVRNVLSSRSTSYRVEIQRVEIVNNFNYDGKIGEFHTVQRKNAPSSIVKANQEVFNGDSIDDVFEGALYKSDQTTLTEYWTRKNKLEEKYLLQISAEDDLRIQQNPIKTFTGDFYGEIPYLSIIEINGINGLFMFVEYAFETDSNITRGKLQQYFTNEIADIDYQRTFDYGKTVKPSIRS